MKKTMTIIGCNGLLGSQLVQYFKEQYEVLAISRQNYDLNISKKEADVLINTNGNSRRFWANQNICADFEKSTLSVMKTISNYPCKKYIYISSSDIYDEHSGKESTSEEIQVDERALCTYGFHKYLSEKLIKKNKPNYLIFRLSLLLGSPLKKGPIFDILNNQPLFITPDTRLQMIRVETVATVIDTLIEKNISSETFNLGGEGVVDFRTIGDYFPGDITYSPNGNKQIYEMNVEKISKLFPIKKSTDYLNEFIKFLHQI